MPGSLAEDGGVTSPLLGRAITHDDSTSEGGSSPRHLPLSTGAEGVKGSGSGGSPAWVAELQFLMLLSAPAIVQLCTQQGLVVTNQMLVGRLGEDALAAAAVGITYFNLMFYFLLGVSSALDTLASQSYGADDKAGVLSWSIAAVSVMVVISGVIGVALWYGKFVALALFRQPEHIAQLVGTYCRWMIPGLLPFVISLVAMKAMQAQNMMWPPALATALTALINVPVNLVLIRFFGFQGAAAAFSVSRVIMFFIIAGYLMCCGGSCYDSRSKEDEGEQPPLSSLLKAGLSPSTQWAFLQLGLPGGLMMAADASSFDVTTAMAGALGTVELDAHTAILTLCVFLFISFPFGVATASTIRVGNLLGAGQPHQARLAGAP